MVLRAFIPFVVSFEEVEAWDAMRAAEFGLKSHYISISPSNGRQDADFHLNLSTFTNFTNSQIRNSNEETGVISVSNFYVCESLNSNSKLFDNFRLMGIGEYPYEFGLCLCIHPLAG